MPAVVSLTQDDVFKALATVLEAIVPGGVEVIQGQVNRVPSPAGPDYIVFWPTLNRGLSTPVATPVGLTKLDHVEYLQPTEVSIQVDVHGPQAANLAQMITTLWRTPWACDAMAAVNPAVQPLHADDPRQMVFQTGEKQLEDRWVIDTLLQANPVTTTVQQFADTVTVGLVEIDTAYPPGDA